MPNVDGEYDGEVERVSIALEPAWFPAVENRGEGILVQLRADAVAAWLGCEPVKRRLNELIAGHDAWAAQRKTERSFPGGPYVLLHTLAHLLIQSLSTPDRFMRRGGRLGRGRSGRFGGVQEAVVARCGDRDAA